MDTRNIQELTKAIEEAKAKGNIQAAKYYAMALSAAQAKVHNNPNWWHEKDKK